MLKFITAYAATALVFLGVDFIWLSRLATRFYSENLGHLLMEKPNLAAAGAFYAFFAVGIVLFAVAPALKAESFGTAILSGALFGFFAYATYDMTNYATLRDWPVVVVAVDVAWGTFLSAISAAAGYGVARMVS